MLEDTATFVQLLQDWEPQGLSTETSAASTDATSSDGSDLLDLFGEFPATMTSNDVPRQLSRSSLCRRRQREQLDQLRAEVVDLEKEYARLRGETASKRRRRAMPSGHRDAVEVERPMIAVWERIARHQRELRRNVECENIRLRELLDEHHKLARRLEKVIHQRALEEQTRRALEKKRNRSTALLQTVSPEHWKTTASSPHWQRIFHILFQNESFWMKELEQELVNISADTNGCTMLEGMYSKVYPFDLSKTSEATWRCYNSQFVAFTDGYYSATSSTDNMLTAESEVALDVSGRTIVLRSNVLIHKICEQADRVVFVWEDWSPPRSDATSEQESSHDTDTSPIRLQLDICISIEQLSKGSSEDDGGGPATLMRVYSVSRSSGTKSSLDDPIRVTCNQLVESFHDSNRRFSQMVELYLVDDALGNHSHPPIQLPTPRYEERV